MTQLQAVRKFAAQVAEHKVVISRQRMENNWAMCACAWSDECRMKIPQNLNYKSDAIDIEFRRDFIARYAPARGFSNTTLAILHEIGHYRTRQEVDEWQDYKERRRAKTQKQYMMLESERRATDWAIQWLYDPNHRRLAKQFEKEFFGY